MDSAISASSSGLTYLMQLLSGSGSPLFSSGQSPSQMQSVLQNASPSDIVQLSDQALQMQEVDGLFGNPETPQTTGLFSAPSPPSSSTTLQGILATLSAPSGSTSSSSTSSLASQMATYRGELQAEQMQTLFGTATTTGVSGTSLNVLA